MTAGPLGRRFGPILGALIVAWLTGGCGETAVQPTNQELRDARDTGSRVEPSDRVEEQVLEQLATISPGVPKTLSGTRVTVGRAYHAASGRICRPVRLQRKGRPGVSRRLVCTEGEAWFFVPDVIEPGGLGHAGPAEASTRGEGP